MLIEKLMSGLYMGECARRILATFATKTQLLGPVPPPKLLQPGSFTTEHLSIIESDWSPLMGGVKRVLRDVLGVDTSALGYESLLMVRRGWPYCWLG
jgi:hexokinase